MNTESGDPSHLRVPATRPPRNLDEDAPTEAEIAEALASARLSDQRWSNDEFYYHGYVSRTDVNDDTPTRQPDINLQANEFQDQDGEARLHWHSIDQTWRLYPPEFAFEGANDADEDDEDEGEGDGPKRLRRRDKLKRLRDVVFSRVLIFKKKEKSGDKPKLSRKSTMKSTK